MTLMWRHRNRPGVPERDVELAGPPLENPTENYTPEGSQDGTPAVTGPSKSWSKEKIQAWADEQGVELAPEGTKAEWLAQIEAEWAEDATKSPETPSEAGDGQSQETGDPTNAVNPEEVQPNGEGDA